MFKICVASVLQVPFSCCKRVAKCPKSETFSKDNRTTAERKQILKIAENPCNYKKKSRVSSVYWCLGTFPFLVDPRGIEPLSENPFTGPSTWVVHDLKFPLDNGHGHPSPSGSPFLHDRYKCELPMHVHHYLTLQPRPWYSSAERAALSRGTALRQPVRRYRQRLILR